MTPAEGKQIGLWPKGQQRDFDYGGWLFCGEEKVKVNFTL
jgi:hypothetical protein